MCYLYRTTDATAPEMLVLIRASAANFLFVCPHSVGCVLPLCIFLHPPTYRQYQPQDHAIRGGLLQAEQKMQLQLRTLLEHEMMWQ
jgi:hypothetical protein